MLGLIRSCSKKCFLSAYCFHMPDGWVCVPDGWVCVPDGTLWLTLIMGKFNSQVSHKSLVCVLLLKHIQLFTITIISPRIYHENTNKYLMALSCGKKPTSDLWNGPNFGGQLETIKYGVCNLLFKWNVVTTNCWYKVVSKMNQILVPIVQPTTIGQVCKIILEHSTLATSHLLMQRFITQPKGTHKS
jgi:hypothetical protein